MSDYTTKLVASLKRQREAMTANGQDTSLIDKRIAAYGQQRAVGPVRAEPAGEATQTKRHGKK